ncbi:unnamed protein product, partial [Mesorhabditis spiculigera]
MTRHSSQPGTSGSAETVAPGQKVVLICCGAYDPPSYAHFRMFERAKDYMEKTHGFKVVEGVISPCGDQAKTTELTPLRHRLRMVEAAIRKSTWIRLSDWEATQKSQPSCIDLLKHFRKKYSSKFGESIEPILLCGGDVIDALIESKRSSEVLWNQKEMDQILGEFGVVVIARPHTNPARTAYLLDAIRKHEKNFHLIEDETYPNDASSTRLRLALRRGESIKYCTSDDVVEYIVEHNLYTQPFNHKPGCAFYQVQQASSQQIVVNRVHGGSTTMLTEVQVNSTSDSNLSDSERDSRKFSPGSDAHRSDTMRPSPMEGSKEHLPQCPLSRKSPQIPKKDYPAPIKVEHHPFCPGSKANGDTKKPPPPTPPVRRSSATRKPKVVDVDPPEDIWEPSTSEDNTRAEMIDLSEPLPSPPVLKTFKKPENIKTDLTIPDPPKIPRVHLPSHVTDWRFGYESPNYDNVTLDELLEASTSWAEYMSQECKRLNAIRDTSVPSTCQSEPVEKTMEPVRLRRPTQSEETYTKPPPPLKDPDKKKKWPFNRNGKGKEEGGGPGKSSGYANGRASVPNLIKASHNFRTHSVDHKKTIRFANAMTKSAEDLSADIPLPAQMSKSCYEKRKLNAGDQMSKSYHGREAIQPRKNGKNDDDSEEGRVTLSFRRYRLAATPETTV